MIELLERYWFRAVFATALLAWTFNARAGVKELAHYRLTGTPGGPVPQVLSDCTGNGNDLHLAGAPSFTDSSPPRNAGGSIAFNGTTDWYSLGRGMGQTSGQLVIEAWVKAKNSDDRAFHCVVSLGDSSAGYWLAQQDKNWVVFVGGEGAFKIGPVIADQWVHLAVEVGSTKVCTFLNGTDAGTCARCAPHTAFTIADSGRGTDAFHGCISEVRVSTFDGDQFNPVADLLTHRHGGSQATAPDADAMIAKAKAYLYAQQKDGNWELVRTPQPPGQNNHVAATQWTGLTALTTYALLSSGESQSDPRIQAAIDFLAKTETTGTYALGLRCLVWGNINLKGPTKQIAMRDRDLLLANASTVGKAKGLFWYCPPKIGNPATYDLSVSQFVPLGLAALAHAGVEVPTPFWKISDDAYKAHQHPDGSWCYDDASNYGPFSHPTASMTAAGVASLLITQEFLHDPIPGYGINRGIDWIGDHFDPKDLGTGYPPPYGLFGVSRIGVASGLKYFGKVDWYQQGLDFLARTQKADGSWVFDGDFASPSQTGLATLFLAYGSAPVVINKLRYSGTTAGKKSLPNQWNSSPQDALNFVGWMSSQVERRLNWQVVDLTDKEVGGLHDAPILWIVGDQTLSFSDADKAKLRRFVDEGGLILGNATSGSPLFIKSFEKLGVDIFPNREFRELADDHPMFRNGMFHRDKSRTRPRLLGLSNGVRELMLLPEQDLSRAFQHRAEREQLTLYILAQEIVLYATESKGLQRKGSSYVVATDPSVAVEHSVKLFRLQYNGNWNPEPAGWTRLAAMLHNNQAVGLDVETVQLGDGRLVVARSSSDTCAALAHLTGTDRFILSDVQRKELKDFVGAGGALVIDAAGGSSSFADSAETELIHLFGDEARLGLAQPLAPNDPLYTISDCAVAEANYRDFARVRLGYAIKTPRIFGIRHQGRIVAYFSREDLSAGLVGERMDGIDGYTPESATDLMRNIIVLSSKLASRNEG